MEQQIVYHTAGILHEMHAVTRESVTYLSFSRLEQLPFIRHGFSTRLGGVSEGFLASMNLGFGRGEDESAVRLNYRRMAAALEMPYEKMILSKQTHTTNVLHVTREHAGNGISRSQQFQDIDGLITNTVGLPLVTSYADCVPLYLVDPVNKAIGLSHSGWRGTVNRMGEITVRKMQQEFGTDPADVIACIGPSICRDCYEVGAEVADCVKQNFPLTVAELVLSEGRNKKYQLDLWELNRQVLRAAGVRDEHLSISDICTCCNSGLLYSHRASQGKRGNLAAFLMLI